MTREGPLIAFPYHTQTGYPPKTLFTCFAHCSELLDRFSQLHDPSSELHQHN